MTGVDIYKQHESMDNEVRGNWMDLWQECSDWSLQTHNNVNRIRTAGMEKDVQRLIDFGSDANFAFASGFFSHLYPTNSIWAKYKHPDPKIMGIKEVADYYEECSRIVHNVLISSNFAQEEFQNLLCMGCFGTTCLSVEPDDESVIKFHNYPINVIRIAENYKHEVDTVSREYELTARQAIQEFGEDTLKEKGLDRIIQAHESSRDDKFKFIHFITPRKDRDPKKVDKLNKKYASYWVAECNKELIKEDGFDYLPYKVARFITSEGSPYAYSPVSMKLGALRRANVMYRDVLLAGERAAQEKYLVSDADDVAEESLKRPSPILKYRASAPGGKPEAVQFNADVGIGVELLQLTKEEIEHGLFNHLFRPLADHQNMTAFEANERSTTDLQLLVPFIGRYTDEKVTPTMTHAFHIVAQAGKLPEPPEILKQEGRVRIEVDYVGRLALASKNFEMMGSISTFQIMMELAQGNPQIMEWFDNVDWDKFGNDLYYSRSGAMNSLRDPKETEAIREERRALIEQQRDIDNLAPVADAAQKLSGKTDPTSIISQMGEG